MPLSLCNTTILEFNEKYDTRALRNGISENQYCAYDPNGMKDSCAGDSGGPLLKIGNDTVVTRIVAIVSFSVSGTCGSRLPSVYTRAASYLDWIESIVWPDNEIIPPLVNDALWYLFGNKHDAITGRDWIESIVWPNGQVNCFQRSKELDSPFSYTSHESKNKLNFHSLLIYFVRI